MERRIVFGDSSVVISLPEDARIVSPGLSLPLEPVDDLASEVRRALEHPVDRPPLRTQLRPGMRVTVAFDDPTVPCYAPVWSTALPAIIAEVEAAGVRTDDIELICANALHRRFTHDELGRLIGHDFVARHHERISCHDAEDDAAIEDLGVSVSGHPVELNRCVTDSDLTIYLNCSTVRGFSGGWKSVCVGLSTYRSIHRHHTPDIMSMSFERNRMHAMLDEMGAVVEERLGSERIFKLETVLANPFSVHAIHGGSVGGTRTAVLDTLRRHQPARRDLIDERVDVVMYGVPDWSPYAAFAHGNPILDLISTGLGYLGGMIEALGKPGCTVVLATPCRYRWDVAHHASYPEVWERVLPETRDPDVARERFEPQVAADERYIHAYRNAYSFHPVHAVMALYPLKRLRHAGRVVIAEAEDPAVPAHCGFDYAPTVEAALDIARDIHGSGATVALVDYPPAFNRV